ncbi:MAG: hypothetical protein ABI629_23940 [bacterium]
MKKLAVVVAFGMAFASPALAGPKDKSQNTLIGPQAFTGNATVNNQVTKFSYKSKGCSVQIAAKDLSGTTDGDIVMCIAEADVISPPAINPPGGGNGVLLLGEVKKGALKIKANLAEVLCNSTGAVQFNGNMRCYLDDAPYRLGGWQTSCLSVAGSAPIPNQEIIPPQKLKVNNTQNVVVGLCQNFTTLGARLPAPSSSLIAVQGALIPLVP